MGFNVSGRSMILGILLAALTAGGSKAWAIGFHFYPANISVQGKPGQVVNRTFTLGLSKDSEPARFQARTEDWWRSPDNSETFYAAPGTLRRSCAKWCSINPVETGLKPGEKMVIKVSVAVPADAQPGGYWAALTVDQIRDPLAPKPHGIGVLFRGSVSVGIFVEVPNATRSAKITGIKVAGETVAVTLRNDGNMPLRVNTKFEFYRAGEEKPAASVTLPGQPLLPEPTNTCEFSGPLPSVKDLPTGKYKVRVIVDTGLDYLMGAEKELDVTRQ